MLVKTVLKSTLRRMSTISTTTTTTSSIFQPNIRSLIKDLDQISPRFEIAEDHINILTDPKEFYQTLKDKISAAKKRVFISSLYIGKNQDELVDCISDALKKEPKLKVYILTDALRGTREAPSKSSASLLAQLMQQHGSQVDIRMYHTPHLNGFNKAIVPKRFNEGFGLQHMKIYGFDDELILSGANLSSDYFTDRQDRYFHFSSKSISDYYFNIQNVISSLSYKIDHSADESKFSMYWPVSNPAPEPQTDYYAYLDKSNELLTNLFKVSPEQSPIKDGCTYVYPVSQFTPLMKEDQSTEKKGVFKLLDYITDPSMKWVFTAGYFNMLPEIKQRLLSSPSTGKVITASPFANGFYLSSGISGCLPDAYLHLSRKFLGDVHFSGKQDDIILNEWKKGVVNTEGGWSYHAKGLWVNAPNEDAPSVTIIGSSNYTRRAYNFDLESNAIVVTSNPLLKSKLKAEVDNLLKNTTEVSLKDFEAEDRRVSMFVRIATKILGGRL
ncbi:hypothetical protein WICPIJ_003376 [Wickerhamomyces pijperi]|uniref:CDP-diacylglycerol--glycerol-3-phosphate 3-phosphatidyltransferase n=1 Tax=Wickerhamomyces pijperi TaxID=599730 RepID=A0A9P8QA07_WICPI|nr:hypothetical protein WICPIJ_003376 [Wickerhamomyces pijperi]